jgi:hypothetical protein
MNLVKHGLASALAVSATLLACGSSSGGDGNGSIAGASPSSAGARASSAGNSSSAGSPGSSGGSTSNGQAGSTPVSSGGCGPALMDQGEQTCPAAFDCIQTKCKAELDTATSTTGACASYLQCTNACGCEDDACISQCTQSTECQASFRAYATCAQSSCITELFSCLGTGSGGSGSGSGGSAGSAGKTCAELSTCCAALTDAAQKTSCTTLVDLKMDSFCDLAYGNFCD